MNNQTLKLTPRYETGFRESFVLRGFSFADGGVLERTERAQTKAFPPPASLHSPACKGCISTRSVDTLPSRDEGRRRVSEGSWSKRPAELRRLQAIFLRAGRRRQERNAERFEPFLPSINALWPLRGSNLGPVGLTIHTTFTVLHGVVGEARRLIH